MFGRAISRCARYVRPQYLQQQLQWKMLKSTATSTGCRVVSYLMNIQSRNYSQFTSTKIITPGGSVTDLNRESTGNNVATTVVTDVVTDQMKCKEIFDRMKPDTQQLVVGLIKHNRTSLAKIITMIESSRSDHKEQSELILDYILYYNRAHDPTVVPVVPVAGTEAVTSGTRTATAAGAPQKESNSPLHGFRTQGPTFRIGFAGPPGAGKSSFIDRFSKFLMEHTDGQGLRVSAAVAAVGLDDKEQGGGIKADGQAATTTAATGNAFAAYPKYHNVAVIPVDPSSHFSGGSILGDKTRMEYLSKLPSRPFVNTDIDYNQPDYYFPNPPVEKEVPVGLGEDNSGKLVGPGGSAYVRASPTRGILGGVAEYTCDIITLCESSGVDTVFIESVGVGQNEVELDEVVDCFVLIVNPGGGDDLQASKKGIMEAADIVLVNKADGELMPQARHTKADYAGSIRYMRTKPSILHSHWKREVVLVSAKTGFGCEEFYNLLLKYYDTMNSTKTVLSFQDSEGGSSARSVTTAVTDVDVVTDTNVSVNCTSGKRHPHVHVTPQQHQHQHQQGNETHATEELNAKGSKEHVTSVFKYKRALQSNYWMWQQFTRQLVTILTHNYKHGHTYGEDDSSETSARSAGNITPDSSPVHNVLSSSSSNSKTNLSKRVSTLAKELEQRIYRDEISSRAAGGLLLKAALDGH